MRLAQLVGGNCNSEASVGYAKKLLQDAERRLSQGIVRFMIDNGGTMAEQ